MPEAAIATAAELGLSQPDLMVHGDLHATNILRGGREPWLAIDPKGWAGDPAIDGAMVIKWRSLRQLRPAGLRPVLTGMLRNFADAAGLDRDRVRRWAELQAVEAAHWGRRYRPPAARSGDALDRVIVFAGQDV